MAKAARHFIRRREIPVGNSNPEVVLSLPDLCEAARESEAAEAFGKAHKIFLTGSDDPGGIWDHLKSPERELANAAIAARGRFLDCLSQYFLYKHYLDSKPENKPARDYLRQVLSRLGENDRVLTLNWDTTVERTLLEDGRWNPMNGYGFEQILHKGFCDGPSEPLDFEIPKSEIVVLKLHGSVGWHQTRADRFVDTVISLRFSETMDVRTINVTTVVLSGPDGDVVISVSAAEGGMLAFVNPAASLAPSTTYTISVNGVVDGNGLKMPASSITFTTAGPAGPVPNPKPTSAPTGPSNPSGGSQEAWIPSAYNLRTGDWRSGRKPSIWQMLPALEAAKGVTALSGQVLTLDGLPLAGVTIEIENRHVKTDATGRFLIPGLRQGHPVLLINGTTANTSSKSYGIFEVGQWIQPRVTNELPFTIWMPLLDTVHQVTIPSPTTAETVITNPLLPGLELHIPAGTVIKDYDGNVVRTISVTPVPIDRPPFPLPLGVDVPIYFTIQPGASYLTGVSGNYPGAWLVYPNLRHAAPGTRFQFWNYKADNDTGWYIYGGGTVAPDGRRIVPDPGVRIYEFTGAMVGNSPTPPKNGPSDSQAADPVDCTTDSLIDSHTDMRVNDVVPITFTRTYISNDNNSRTFGIGATDNYEIFLVGDFNPWTYINLILSDGEQLHYVNTNTGYPYDFANSYYVLPNPEPGRFFGSTITYGSTGGWKLKLRDGTVYLFPDSFNINSPGQAALVGIRDRHGNKITIHRDANGNKTEITSPNDRWLKFTSDGNNRITQIQDNIGRTVSYIYDTGGRLHYFTDANSGVTTYTYDAANRMKTKTDQLNHQTLLLQYDVFGRVQQQTLADNSTWQFKYFLNVEGVITHTKVTDPRGIVEDKTFNTTGFALTDTLALGLPEQQKFTYMRDPGTSFVQSVTDQLGRQTAYEYNPAGDVTSISHLAGTANAATTSFSYEGNYHQLTGITDPLGNSWSITTNATGDPVTIQDPLNNQTIVTYSPQGQPLTVKDPANDLATFGYNVGDLTSIIDPAGNHIARVTDGAGRLATLIDPLGNSTSFSYDPLDRLTQITDANGGMTTIGYNALI